MFHMFHMFAIRTSRVSGYDVHRITIVALRQESMGRARVLIAPLREINLPPIRPFNKRVFRN